jgi:hypothetical protein
MELAEALRDALEAQVLEHEPAQAALLLRDAVSELGPTEVADGLLDTAAVALRLMVSETDESLPLDELIERLTVDGAVPGDSAGLLAHMLTHAAAIAGGVGPPSSPQSTRSAPSACCPEPGWPPSPPFAWSPSASSAPRPTSSTTWSAPSSTSRPCP